MPLSWAFFASFLLAAAGYILGRSRAFATAGPDARALHSRPTYHGTSVGLMALLPSLGVLAVAAILRMAGVLTDETGPVVGILALVAAVIGLGLGVTRIGRQYQARNAVERMVLGLLMLCSLIAIVTTLGIVLSLVFETGRFFQVYDWKTFFFGTEWTPRFQGNSQLGILPLLWGTLYVSAIALLVAVPIGLFAAVYMSEYASRWVRGFVKPAIEVLAGIPTIVYGLFALITVGPLLRDYFAQPLGLGNSGTSVLTAGLVMGIMLIPFVSSLSDDIINAVPQSLRDGALGLGSTPSETVRQVVLPAALPGIVGAVLLAASRAIGETMIVVLGAGAAAQMSLNPLEAMTTITVKIVSQLTGDSDFNSPETLVAFALGLTLFVITLALNVVALIIVRKYREQYE
ncbi:phosphate ABC transporter permease subunit PstC [Paracoccus sp. YIM 132242]|uniref:Phosphate transport system permease protein n=1 Tax=Paracoccus lichenicola TaxID=2665644 RepID=A0A6L6HRK0_9RHOB|nr:phosphate ABC transporter permease subunit PstC [Paracoccus lichenicola]MTE00665.1 phosphate ABC transporter permease subunit PstC [Paracoccus lichenicola]